MSLNIINVGRILCSVKSVLSVYMHWFFIHPLYTSTYVDDIRIDFFWCYLVISKFYIVALLGAKWHDVNLWYRSPCTLKVVGFMLYVLNDGFCFVIASHTILMGNHHITSMLCGKWHIHKLFVSLHTIILQLLFNYQPLNWYEVSLYVAGLGIEGDGYYHVHKQQMLTTMGISKQSNLKSPNNLFQCIPQYQANRTNC